MIYGTLKFKSSNLEILFLKISTNELKKYLIDQQVIILLNCDGEVSMFAYYV